LQVQAPVIPPAPVRPPAPPTTTITTSPFRFFPFFPFGPGASEKQTDTEFSEKARRSEIDVNLGLEAIGQFARRQVQR
jgi:hypothetical protein